MEMKKILIGVGIVVVAIAGFMAYKMLQPVPEGLDFSRMRSSAGGHFLVGIAPENPSFRRNDLHAWIATVQTPQGVPVEDAEIAVDGGMPMHGHGLPTNPEVTQVLGQGRYKIDGVRFNMGGWWEFKLAITAGGISDAVTFNLKLQR
jgi:hypothetical protein